MGIQGLLQSLAPVIRPHVSLEEYRGKTLAVDGATMLYRAAYIIAEDLALYSPQVPSAPTSTSSSSNFLQPHRPPPPPPPPPHLPSRYWPYIERRLLALLHHGITPLFVLDGRRSPLKAETDLKRTSLRKEALRQGHALRARALSLPPTHQYHAERTHLLSQASTYFQKAVSIPRALVEDVTVRLKRMNIKFIVAPYEADAQVAWLCRVGLAHGVLSEDSDILVYVALAPKPFPVLFKLELVEGGREGGVEEGGRGGGGGQGGTWRAQAQEIVFDPLVFATSGKATTPYLKDLCR
eukprot:evm.model.NODE_4804_length_7516_cov_33.980576.1